jgi:hypothetical protein
MTLRDHPRRTLMKIQLLPFAVVGSLAWGVLASPAQETLPRPEQLPEAPPKEVAPKTKAEPPIEGHPRPCAPVPKVLYYERDMPVQIIEAREVIQVDKVPTMDLVFRPEKRVVTDMVMKPREVSRVVCYTALEPTVETDCHGHACTVMKPVERTRIQKDLEFVAVPVERTEVVMVPFLKEAEELVPRTTVLLEYHTVMQKQGFALAVPSEAPPPTRYVVTPEMRQGCATGEHP